MIIFVGLKIVWIFLGSSQNYPFFFGGGGGIIFFVKVQNGILLLFFWWGSIFSNIFLGVPIFFIFFFGKK